MMKELSIGVDLGGTNVSAALCVPSKGKLVGDVLRGSHNGDFLSVVLGNIQRLTKNRPEDTRVTGVGIGCAGLVDTDKGRVITSNNLSIADYPLVRELEDRTGLPCRLYNDVEAAAFGECRFGAGTGKGDSLIVFIGTGIGARFVHKGKILQGARGLSGEMGQMRVNISSNESRPLERLCSRKALSKIVSGSTTALSYDEITASTGYGNALRQATQTLAIQLVNLVFFLDPDRIILGGGCVEQLPGFFEKVVEATEYYQLSERPCPEIVRASMGNRAALIGAASLAYGERSLRRK
jgi:glucokinase